MSPFVGALLAAGVGLGAARGRRRLGRCPVHAQFDRHVAKATSERSTDVQHLPRPELRRGLAYVATQWPVVVVAAGAAGWSSPSVLAAGVERRNHLIRSEAVAVWAEMLRDLLVSNAGLREAIAKTARFAPEPIAAEVRALEVRAQRGSLAPALRRFADEVDDAVADTVIVALLLAERRAVSDLGSMLAATAASARDYVAMQLRVDVARARVYRTAQLIAGVLSDVRRAPRPSQSNVPCPVRHLCRSAGARRHRDHLCVGGLDHARSVPPRGLTEAAAARSVRSMMWAAVSAGGLAAGLVVMVRGWHPAPRPLAELAEELRRERRAPGASR